MCFAVDDRHWSVQLTDDASRIDHDGDVTPAVRSVNLVWEPCLVFTVLCQHSRDSATID